MVGNISCIPVTSAVWGNPDVWSVVEMVVWMIHKGVWRQSSFNSRYFLPAHPTKHPSVLCCTSHYLYPWLLLSSWGKTSNLQQWQWLDPAECTGEIKELSLRTGAAGRSLVQLVKIPFYGEVSALHHLLLRLWLVEGSLMSKLEHLLFSEALVTVIVTVFHSHLFPQTVSSLFFPVTVRPKYCYETW